MLEQAISVDEKLVEAITRLEQFEPFSHEETLAFNAMIKESGRELGELPSEAMRRRCDLLERMMLTMKAREQRMRQQRMEISDRLRHIELVDQWAEGSRQCL